MAARRRGVFAASPRVRACVVKQLAAPQPLSGNAPRFAPTAAAMEAKSVLVSYVVPGLGLVVANAMFTTPLLAVLAVRKKQDLGVSLALASPPPPPLETHPVFSREETGLT